MVVLDRQGVPELFGDCEWARVGSRGTQWLEAKLRQTNDQPKDGVWKPALLFAFSCMWMLQEIELAIVMKENIQIQEEDRITSLYLRV